MSRHNFPECCAKCLAEKPTQAWKISGSENKPGAANSTVIVASATHLPVCAACYRGLTGLSWLCWLVACSIAAVAVGATIYYAPQMHLHLANCPPWASVPGLALVGGLIVWASGSVLNTLLVDSSVGSYDPQTQTIEFANRRYKELFETRNTRQIDDAGWLQG